MKVSNLPHLPRRQPPLAAAAWVTVVLAAAVLSCSFPTRPAGTTEPQVPVSPTPTIGSAETSTPTPLPPSETPADTPTATITPTATLGPPTFTTSVNANCRTGPGLMYEVVRVVMAGTSEGIMGRDAASTWWVIQGEASCWISNVTGTASGDLSGVPVIPAPPTPTPTRTPTATATPTPTVFILLPPIIRTIWIPPIPLVSSAAVTVDRTTCMPCPCRATWSGVVSATGPLTAEYVWQTRTGSGPWGDTGLFGSLIFPGAGALSTLSFYLQYPYRPVGETVSARLHVTAPNSVYSNEVSVRYCAP